MARTGVLLTGFGGPDSLDAVGPFMANLMGREPSEELLARVRTRYLAIGGASPLPGIAREIAGKLGEAFEGEGHDIVVGVGMRYWQPYIGDTLTLLKEAGCDRVITLSLSPFESKVAQESYREAIAEAAGPLGIEIVEAPLVSTLDEYASYYAGATAVAIEDMQPNQGAIVVFSAHSLPLGDLDEDDPYVAGLERVASAVAHKLGLEPGEHGAGDPVLPGFSTFGSAATPRAWFLVYQSKGNRPGGWLGPDLDDLIDVAAESEVAGLVVAPIGFVTDHMETLYDLDIVAADRAVEKGLEFVRVPAPNMHDTLVQAMVRTVADLL